MSYTVVFILYLLLEYFILLCDVHQVTFKLTYLEVSVSIDLIWIHFQPIWFFFQLPDLFLEPSYV